MITLFVLMLYAGLNTRVLVSDTMIFASADECNRAAALVIKQYGPVVSPKDMLSAHCKPRSAKIEWLD